MSGPPARRRPLIGLMVLLVLLGLGSTVRGSAGAFTATITNSSDTVATTTATYFTCTSAAIGAPATGALFAYPFGESNGGVATDISGNGNNGTYRMPGTLTFGVADSTVCPRDHTTVMTFNGVNGYVTGPADSNPQVFSEEIWFKTSTSGYLMGFGSHPTGQDPPNGYDRGDAVDGAAVAPCRGPGACQRGGGAQRENGCAVAGFGRRGAGPG